MTIDIWSDYACPFCYIGYVRLENVLRDFPGEVTVHLRSFELDLYADRKCVSSTLDRFARKYGLTLPEAQDRIAGIEALGREEGIDFRYTTTRYTNTFDALRLTKYAEEENVPGIHQRLFDAYFTKNLELSDHEVLRTVAVQCGLQEDGVRNVLESDLYAQAVRKDEEEAMRRGIHGVPYYLINQTHGLSGAVPGSMLLEALEQIAQYSSNENTTDGAAMHCDATGCHI